jgi:hypothetical protein
LPGPVSKLTAAASPSRPAGPANGATLSLPVEIAAALKLAPGDEAALLPLPTRA